METASTPASTTPTTTNPTPTTSGSDHAPLPSQYAQLQQQVADLKIFVAMGTFPIFQPLNVFLGSTCSMRNLSFVASDENNVITTTSDDVDT